MSTRRGRPQSGLRSTRECTGASQRRLYRRPQFAGLPTELSLVREVRRSSRSSRGRLYNPGEQKLPGTSQHAAQDRRKAPSWTTRRWRGARLHPETIVGQFSACSGCRSYALTPARTPRVASPAPAPRLPVGSARRELDGAAVPGRLESRAEARGRGRP